MKYIIYLVLIVTLLSGCQSKYEGNEAFIDIGLLEEIDNFIQRQDSIAASRTTVDYHKSFEISFSDDEYLDCKIFFISNFDFYDSEQFDGYFQLRDKYINIYGVDSNCNSNLINKKGLKTGKIDDLVDTSVPDFVWSLYDPTIKTYHINDSNKLVFESFGPPAPPNNPNWEYHGY